MRILILGAKGMAGHMTSEYLKENTNWDIISWGKSEFEVNNTSEWKNKISEVNEEKKLDYIINFIGILKPVANADPILGTKINSLFPHELAEIGTQRGIKIVHLSTDCWSDLDVYGRSKRAGELNYSNHLTIRTSIIGPELKNTGSGLFQWFMMQKKEVNGFVNHFWDGLTTLELAKQIKNIIENKPVLGNIIELRTKPKVDKFKLLNYLNSVFNKNLLIHKKETETVDKCVENPEVCCNIHLIDQIKELHKWMKEHNIIYNQYNL